MKQHGLSGSNLWEVTNATLLSKLTYASQAWWGMIDAEGKLRLQSVIKKAIKHGFLPKTYHTIQQLCEDADASLFLSILKNSAHVLNQLLPPIKHTSHDLRPRAHNRVIPSEKDSFFCQTFLIRMLSLNSF